MKLKLKYHALLLVFASLLMLYSCGDDFLDVSDPTVLSEDIFPKTVDDLDPILIDVFGRLQETEYGTMMRFWPLLSHCRDHGYNGAQYNEFALNELNPNLSNVRNFWERSFLAIGKINTLLAAVEDIRNVGNLSESQLTKLDQIKGQALFIRAYTYFYLINYYGEYPIITEADKSKMGIPIWNEVTSVISDAARPRATQGEVWDFIISDLLAAETLLDGVVFTEKSRPNEWAVKAFLGKSYILTLQYDKARIILKDVIDNSGKSLVSYDVLRSMFNGQNEFNSESIFEINYTPDPLGGTDVTNTGANWNRAISVTYVAPNGVETTNGFGNLFIHDMNIPRFGFDDTTTVNQKRPDYLEKSLQVRLDKSVDPRLYVGTFQPYVDSVRITSVWSDVAKSRVESYNAKNVKAWGSHKYNVVDRLYTANAGWCGVNMYAMRLAEVYLLYAEALIKTGAPTEGLEYINKVHRRAYNLPVNTPSPTYDYASLTARTKTVDAADPLANDPLKYERWAEFFSEGQWWIDVRRFGMGAAEAAYYKKVMGGALVWRETKYAMPIPTAEMDSNSEMIQNPGY